MARRLPPALLENGADLVRKGRQSGVLKDRRAIRASLFRDRKVRRGKEANVAQRAPPLVVVGASSSEAALALAGC